MQLKITTVNAQRLPAPVVESQDLFTGCADEKRAALKPVEYCEYAPRAVLENPHALHYLLARDATTGSFKDFDEHFGAGKQQKKSSFKLTLKRHGSVA